MTIHSWILVTLNCLSIMFGKLRFMGYIIFKTPNFFEFLYNPLYIAHPLHNFCGGGQELVFVCPVDVLLRIEGPFGGRGRLLAVSVLSGAGVTTAK